MSLPSQLATRFREVMLDGRWVANTNFQDQLSDVNLELATRKTGTHNSIAELTFHIHYYIKGLLDVMQGGELTIRDKYSFDMPNISTEEDWQQLRSRLLEDSESFAQGIEAMSEDEIKGPFVRPEYGTWLRSLDGTIEHAYYHLGQVSLLKKLLEKH